MQLVKQMVNESNTMDRQIDAEVVLMELGPAPLYLMCMVTLYICTAVLHPSEMTNIVHGIWYFLCLPSGQLFLQICQKQEPDLTGISVQWHLIHQFYHTLYTNHWFKVVWHLKKHLHTHSGGKPHSCNICWRTTAQTFPHWHLFQRSKQWQLVSGLPI